jgi:hypothetical protein
MWSFTVGYSVKEIRMKTQKAVNIAIGSIFIIAGTVWSIMFPKTTDLFRPDFVASVAIGVGLILPGIGILFVKRSTALPSVLSILLLWSLLLNAFLFSEMWGLAKLVSQIGH